MMIEKASSYPFYAGERKVFGRPIGANQAIQGPLAAAYSKLECAWLGILKAASMFDAQQDPKAVGDVCSMAKYLAIEAGTEGAYHTMQTFGGYGFAREYHVERWFREMQLARVAPITQQMTLNYVAEHILGMPRSY